MTCPAPSVTTSAFNPSSIPDRFAPGAQLLLWLAQNDKLRDLERLELDRDKGGDGIDGMLIVLVFFMLRGFRGIKPMCQALGPEHAVALGQLAGRDHVFTQSSGSRMLSSVREWTARPYMHSLLLDTVDARALLAKPSLNHLDAVGQCWFVADMDVTKIPYRQRGVPKPSGKPVERLAKRLAAPGYSGRKRGLLQVADMQVTHRCSQLSLGVHASPGNGDRAAGVKMAAQAVQSAATKAGFGEGRAVLVGDGAHGNHPDLLTCREHGVALVSRLTRPHLLDDQNVRDRLRAADWTRVRDSGSGPERYATDIGMVRIATQAEPELNVRVVAARYRPESSRESLRGVAVGDEQVELFIADVGSDEWPAHEVVTLYYQRAQQENGFGQDQREWMAKETLSYSLFGFEFSRIAMHMVKNWCIARGVELSPALPNHRVPVRAPAGPTALPKLTFNGDNTTASAVPPADPVEADEELSRCRTALQAELGQWHTTTDTLQSAGWTIGPDVDVYRCPEGHEARLRGPATRDSGDLKLHVAISGTHCRTCPLRKQCNTSANPDKAKTVSFTAKPKPNASTEELKALWEETRQAQRRQHSAIALHSPKPLAKPRRATSDRAALVVPHVDDGVSACWPTTRSPFSPAAAYNRCLEAMRSMRLEITTVKVAAPTPMHPLMVPEGRTHARRRQSREQRVSAHALRSTARPAVQLTPLKRHRPDSASALWIRSLCKASGDQT